MPGFGSGSFGHFPFGHWGWSRRVLFELMPELHRQQDKEQGGLFETFTEGLRLSFDRLRLKIQTFPELRDPLLVRTQFDEVASFLLGPVRVKRLPLEQRGVDGSINTFREFVTPTGRFRDSDVGKELTLSRSSTPTNNRAVLIARIVDANTVVLDALLQVDPGPLKWDLRQKVDPAADRITVEVRQGDVDLLRPGHLLNDGFSDFEVLARRHFKTDKTERHFLTEREGTDGSIDGLGQLVSPTLLMTQRDVGKRMLVLGIGTDDTRVEITKVVDAFTVALAGGPYTTNAGPLTWALMPFPELDLAGLAIPRGVVEQEGVDLSLTVIGSVVESASFRLTTSDVGKILTLRGSLTPDNNQNFEIASVLTANRATFVIPAGPPALGDDSNLTWELRSASALGDLRQVDVRAPSLITHLAKDFGIEVDTQENEDRQRSWVKNVSQWIDLKGLAKGYQILAAISGFDADVRALYRITQDIAVLLPIDRVYEVGEAEAGRSGSDGSLADSGGLVQLTAPSAVFRLTDEGLQIRIRNAATLGNNKLYTIEQFLDANTVNFRVVDTAVTPDANNGLLEWDLLRLFTDLAPERPIFDEVNADLMADIANDAIVAVAGAVLVDGTDRFTINDGVNPTVTFEFDNNASVSGGNIAVPFTAGDSANVVAASIAAAINSVGVGLRVTALAVAGSARVSLTHDDSGTAVLTETVADPGFLVTSPLPFYAIDARCEEAGFTTQTPIQAINVNSISVSLQEIQVTGTAEHPDAPEVVVGVNNWRFVDSLGGSYFLETVPTLIGVYLGLPLYAFQIVSNLPPATGAGVLDYECTVQLSCDYCAASKVLLNITAGSISSESGQAVERAFERVLDRMIQVTPAHVQLIPRLVTEFEAVLTLSATIDTGFESFGDLYAPLTAFYDDVEGDVIGTDIAIVATIETP